MISVFQLDAWIRRPHCRERIAVNKPLTGMMSIVEEGCRNMAVCQVIDDSKRGTSEYCTYKCETHKPQTARQQPMAEVAAGGLPPSVGDEPSYLWG